MIPRESTEPRLHNSTKAAVEDEIDWRLPVFEAGKYLIAFDGAALLLLELFRRRKCSAIRSGLFSVRRQSSDSADRAVTEEMGE